MCDDNLYWIDIKVKAFDIFSYEAHNSPTAYTQCNMILLLFDKSIKYSALKLGPNKVPIVVYNMFSIVALENGALEALAYYCDWWALEN